VLIEALRHKPIIAVLDATGPEPLAVLIATAGHIIIGYVDTYFDREVEPEDWMLGDDEEPFEPIAHDEPNDTRRRAALLARLRQINRATWLIVHDAHAIEGWTEQGFRVVEPPASVPAEDAVLVLAWGELPEAAEALLRACGLSWHLGRHRYPSQYANEE